MKNRYELVEILKENNCKIGIEIGSYMGNYAKFLLDNWNGFLFLVDAWKKFPESEYEDVSNQESPKDIISCVFDNLSGYEDRTVLIRGDSNTASTIFRDDFFDFIYIDANHKYNYVFNDMKLWYPKLKEGGIFSGHDFILDYSPEFADENGDVHVWTYTVNPNISQYAGLFGVNKAVNDFCNLIKKSYEITEDEYFATWYFKK